MVDTKTAAKTGTKGKKTLQITEAYRQEVLRDFTICSVSRECSILARKEVLTGRANFGIIGDGKEVAQVAMAKAFRKGDFRAGYYRDQTLMLALGVTTVEEFFAQLYGDIDNDPFSGGRQMNCHFATQMLDGKGGFSAHKERYNITSDTAPTAGQMARSVGLALASKKFRETPAICGDLSDQGNEVTFCTIGDASTSEGAFWESVNAAGVQQIPLAISVWDDGYGISVPKKYQTTKESISEVLAGFQYHQGIDSNGIDIHIGKGWDYPGLCELYTRAIGDMRRTHRPALFHIQEVTQQLGHSTSGDHRRYKSPERLAWEEASDCNRCMADWMVENGIATPEEIEQIKQDAKKEVQEAAMRAYRGYHDPVARLRAQLTTLGEALQQVHPQLAVLGAILDELNKMREPLRYEIAKTGRRMLTALGRESSEAKAQLQQFLQQEMAYSQESYSSHLYSDSECSALRIPVVPARYSAGAPMKDGFEILNICFDKNFEKYPNLFAFGEDVGHIGDVNQGFRGLQQKFGVERIFDTGIREWTIMGQAIGMAMRGLRPIAEIQYLDYLLYGLAPLSDDLCTLRWRTKNLQAAPAIIRTRGHRLVGVWHAGSPMGMMLGSLRGMWICVPRNMVQAAGMYNTLLQSDDPAIVVEVLNGYRIKETLPDNIDTFTVPLGVPEIIRQGTDVTLVTYGACVRVAEEACDALRQHNISVELIDVQTLLPFDLPQTCVESLKKTNRIVFVDEDFQGGATAYMMQQILEKQGGYQYLDAKPLTLYASEHRTAYGQDGDYYSKPQAEDIVENVLRLVAE